MNCACHYLKSTKGLKLDIVWLFQCAGRPRDTRGSWMARRPVRAPTPGLWAFSSERSFTAGAPSCPTCLLSQQLTVSRGESCNQPDLSSRPLISIGQNPSGRCASLCSLHSSLFFSRIISIWKKFSLLLIITQGRLRPCFCAFYSFVLCFVLIKTS